MNNDELLKIFLASIPGIVVGAIGVLAGWWRDRNRPQVDYSEAEKNEAEIERIRHEITKDILAQSAEDRRAATEDRKRMQSDIDALRNEFRTIIKFAQIHYDGSKVLYAQVVEHNIDPPRFIPAEKFPTGPLGKLAT